MKNTSLLKPVAVLFFLIATVYVTLLSCRREGEPLEGESLTYGKATIMVDNTVQPIVEDVLAVFHSVYGDAHIEQVNLPENELLRALKDTFQIAVLPRNLTAEEEAAFRNRKIEPKVTVFATDAVALITSKTVTDTVLNLEEVYSVLRGEVSAKVKKLVFDNPNSSTVQYLLAQAGVKTIPSENIYALKSNEEVIKFVRSNPGAIGIIGVNWLLQPPNDLVEDVENVRVLALNSVKKGAADNKYYKPSQSNIATGSYPLTRKLYVLNYQGKKGLGMGFATYISAPEGQRIILKSGLVPVTIPPREVEVQ